MNMQINQCEAVSNTTKFLIWSRDQFQSNADYNSTRLLERTLDIALSSVLAPTRDGDAV